MRESVFFLVTGIILYFLFGLAGIVIDVLMIFSFIGFCIEEEKNAKKIH